ncbi:Prefoldin subunit-domain-containing protein [Plectosphaerella plurivora]|uniref:Prefoldin subunit-domain-containing protein n=1 Tax=Plectosphaerella plurivora TaxID=936078 RepID=A0A9P9A803_9PEZI|nr:Prefoldin subunit-domain-containing protein [Plectosphaerella plurivora]
MAPANDDGLEGLEHHRQRLEENIEKLRKALQHWRQWDAEYEALKEEVETLPAPAAQKDLSRLRTEYQGVVIDKKEIDEIFGHVGTKPAEQIVSLLSRRIDYVTKNLETLETQLHASEDKLAALDDFDQHVRDEEGLPLTEIIEELDEDGNVLSSRLSKPGDSTSHVREILEQAGVRNIPPGVHDDEKPSEAKPEASTTTPVTEAATKKAEASPRQPAPPAAVSATPAPTTSIAPAKAKPAASPPPPAKAPISTAEKDDKPRYQSISLSDLAAEDEDGPEELPAKPARKKGVAFTEDTKGEEMTKSRTARRVEEIMRTAREQETLAQQTSALPEGESEEDAFLRREMLKYGMDEVGAVVAELTLEEGTDDEDEGFDEVDYTDDDDDDDEDDHGRYKGRMVDDDYMARMLELEKKLGVKSRFTEQAEKDDSGSDAEREPEGLGRIVIKRDDGPSQTGGSGSSTPSAPLTSSLKSSQTDAKGKKSVKFASALDIAPEKEPAAPTPTPAAPRDPTKPRPDDPLSSTIVERSGPAKRQDTPRKPKRVSRFKQHQAGGDAGKADNEDSFNMPKGPLDMPVRFLDQDRPIAPSGPKDRTIAESLVERTTNDEQALADADEEFIDQGLADEYYKRRSDFIHRHGGFLQEDESPIQPLDEADGGRRISKFKAARLSKQ